jgi:predicted nucleic acid-binding protein
VESERGFLVDTNILFDYLSDDEEWFEWSVSMLTQAADAGYLAINPIIYAEISARFARVEDVDAALPPQYFRRVTLPWDAAFLAARAFAAYRQRGGTRTAPLPDFFIGAHAAVAGLTLLTRDASRYIEYFPKLSVIAP